MYWWTLSQWTKLFEIKVRHNNNDNNINNDDDNNSNINDTDDDDVNGCTFESSLNLPTVPTLATLSQNGKCLNLSFSHGDDNSIFSFS